MKKLSTALSWFFHTLHGRFVPACSEFNTIVEVGDYVRDHPHCIITVHALGDNCSHFYTEARYRQISFGDPASTF
jgi:hypothetical protein